MTVQECFVAQAAPSPSWEMVHVHRHIADSHIMHGASLFLCVGGTSCDVVSNSVVRVGGGCERAKNLFTS